MKRLLLLGVALSVALIFFSKTLFQACADTGRVEIKVDTSAPSRVSRELYGFNTNQYSAYYSVRDADYLANTQLLRPLLLRFPGGLEANMYHWQISGFREKELDSAANDRSRERYKANVKRLTEKRGGTVSFDEFMSFCKKVGAKPVVVVNLFTGSPEESGLWVKYAKEKGYEVSGWELSNELFNEDYRNKFPEVGTYIRVAKEHAAAMRAANPAIRISAVAGPVGFHLSANDAKGNFERAWNEGLAKENFYDAVSVHLYTYAFERRISGIEQARAYLFGSSDVVFDTAIDYYRRLFGGKDLWVTEWNLASPQNKSDNTMLHAMYTGDFFISLLKSGVVTKAAYHVLGAGAGNGFAVFTPKSEETNFSLGSRETLKHTNFPVFELIGRVMAGVELLYRTNVAGGPVIEGVADLRSTTLPGIKVAAVSTTGGTAVLVSNRSDKSVPASISVDGTALQGNVSYNFVSNERLDATNNSSAMVFSKNWSGPAAGLVIPPNSFGVVEWNKRP